MSDTKRKDLAARQAQAARSGFRVAGYCGLAHPDGIASCTRPPHADRRHVDYYKGRKTLTDVTGTEWTE